MQIIDKISRYYIENGQEDKDSAISYYITLSIIGLTVTVLLQGLNLPFLYKFYAYLEKGLILIGRLSENEARCQIAGYKKVMAILESEREQYFLHDFFKEDDNEVKIAKDEGQKSGKHGKASSNYISSKIANQRLSRSRIILSVGIAIIFVIAFFVLIFVILIEIQTKLGNAIEVSTKADELILTIEEIAVAENFLLTYPFVEEDVLKHISLAGRFETMLELYKKDLATLEEIVNKDTFISFFYKDSLNAAVRDDFQEFFKQDSCEYLSKHGVESHACERKNSAYNFDQGMVGYLSNRIAFRIQILPYVQRDAMMNTDEYIKIYSQQRTVNQIFNNDIRVKIEEAFLLDSVYNSNIQAIDSLLNIFNILFLVGGFSMATVFAILFLIVFFFCRRLYIIVTTAFLMIPFEKLNEDSTIHLLKNLQDI